MIGQNKKKTRAVLLKLSSLIYLRILHAFNDFTCILHLQALFCCLILHAVQYQKVFFQ